MTEQAQDQAFQTEILEQAQDLQAFQTEPKQAIAMFQTEILEQEVQTILSEQVQQEIATQQRNQGKIEVKAKVQA